MDCPKLPWMIDFHSTHDGTILNQQYDAAYASNYIEHLCKINLDSSLPKKRLSGIMCSIASTITSDLLEQMMEAGMSIAVIKLAHCSMKEAKEIIEMTRKTVMNYSLKIGRVYALGIGIDIKGPEMRTGTFMDGSSKEMELVEGETTKITNDPMYAEFVTKDMIYVNLQNIGDVIPGDKIHINNTANGQISLSARNIVGSIINCIIETTGKMTNRASVSLEAVMNVPLISKEDKEAIEFCGQEKVSFVFIPYTEQGDTIKEVRNMLGKEGRATMIVAKIENVAGVYSIDNIIAVADAILISRCALASELTPQKVVVVEKMIVGKCNKNGTPVILAPSVLQSMSTNPIPNSSEIADVTSSITDGVDCFLLSRETTLGSHPVESIKALDSICRTAEPLLYQVQMFRDLTITQVPVEPLYAIAISAVEASMKCNAAAIMVTTVTGRSAKLLSRFRPRCPIIAITRYAHVARFLNMWRGVDPVHYIRKAEKDWSTDIEKRMQFGLTYGKHSGYIRTGDAVIVVTGTRMGTGFTNGLKIIYASEFDTCD